MTKIFRKKQPMTFFSYCEYDKISDIRGLSAFEFITFVIYKM